jgi:serine/threonine protein kinase
MTGFLSGLWPRGRFYGRPSWENTVQTDDRVFLLLERWLVEAEAGRLLPVDDLCRDCPDLLPDAERRIAVLRRFHVLSRDSESTYSGGEAGPETKPDNAARNVAWDYSADTGARIGRYEIIAKIGQGGMGVVYKARDMKLGRTVVLKFVRAEAAANPTAADRFLREAKALAAIRHDHVVEIYDYGDEHGVRFITMPLLAGETLEAKLEREGPLSTAEVLRIGTELAEGLAAVHAKGLIHRDLKPSNVWLEEPGGRVKLLDFGLARDRAAAEPLTSTGAVVGTPAYMSPEQVNGLDLDARSDLFSLGSVLYRAATGHSPFRAKTATATLKAVGEIDPPPARTVYSEVPPGLSDLIESLHRKNPAVRPSSATEVGQELRRLATAHFTPTTEWPGATTGATHRKSWFSIRRVAAAIALGLSLVLCIILYPLVKDRFRESRPDPDSPSEVSGSPTPLRVGALEVHHYASIDNKRTHERRLLGTDSFGATPDDDITVSARLSRPAYCYVIVFRPDGEHEVLYPQRSSDVPDRTGEPRYPSTVRNMVYGLTEGTGLWLVALVASDSPLPAYGEWRKEHPAAPWMKSDGESGVVWFDDGQWLELVTPQGIRNRGERGHKEVAGSAPIVRVVDWLKAETGGVVSAVAFTVQAKK